MHVRDGQCTDAIPKDKTNCKAKVTRQDPGYRSPEEDRDIGMQSYKKLPKKFFYREQQVGKRFQRRQKKLFINIL